MVTSRFFVWRQRWRTSTGQGVADALVANHAALLVAECQELVLAAQWADLHPAESLEPRPVLAGMERPRRFGGFGTPEAGEFCAAELAVLTGRSVGAGRDVDRGRSRPAAPAATALDGAGGGHGPGVAGPARRQAHPRQRTQPRPGPRGGPHDGAHLATLPWGRFVDLLEARIVEADPAAAEARREAAELDRFVVTGQSSEHGLKTLIARATAGEVIYLVAMVDRLAQILEARRRYQPRRRQTVQGIGHPRPPGPRPGPAPQARDPFGG